jgi:hypothetical protein
MSFGPLTSWAFHLYSSFWVPLKDPDPIHCPDSASRCLDFHPAAGVDIGLGNVGGDSLQIRIAISWLTRPAHLGKI